METRSKFEKSDIQAAKREVIKLGQDQGYLDEETIMASLPVAYMLPDEMETFLFTLEMMEIEVRLKDGSNFERAARLRIVGRETD